MESYLPVVWVWNYFRQQSGFYKKGMRMTVTGRQWNIKIWQKIHTKHHCIKPINRLEYFYTYRKTAEYNETLRAHHLSQKLTLTDSEKNKNLAIIPFQGNTLLLENYSRNQCQYYCLEYDLIKNRRNLQKQKRIFS